MNGRLNARNFFHSLKYVGEVIAIWPLKIGANKQEALIHELKWWLAFINASALLVPLLLAVYYFHNDSITLTKTLSELTALCEIFINLIQCRIQRGNFQVILGEIEDVIDRGSELEQVILEKYLNRYKNFQLFVGSSFISTAVLFSSMPLLCSQPLPADAWYPFTVELTFLRIFLYVTQVLAIFQTGFGISVDFTVATMLWYSAAKTELLEKRLSAATSEIELKECARRYQELVL